MRVIFAAAAAIVALTGVSGAAQAGVGIPFVEYDYGNGVETLSVVGFPGAVITGSQDNWKIDLSSTGINFWGYPVLNWYDPSNGTYDSLTNNRDGTFTLVSDLPSDPGTNSCAAGGSVFSLGTSCFVGTDSRFNSYYASFTEVPTPEPTTMAILGLGLAGLGFVRRRRD